jgi:hypothetical protein
MRHYAYVGPESIRAAHRSGTTRAAILSAADILEWIRQPGQKVRSDGTVTVTFVVDPAGQLWIADRHSEHVACARGRHVLSAGEMTFLIDKKIVEVTEVTNQSTGYCPEPDSWLAVALALTRAQLKHPPRFTTAFIFRRCNRCGNRNLVKDEWFECGVCGTPLSREWNFESSSAEPSEDS